MARAQVLGQQVQVSLGGGDLQMSQNHREPHDVAALAELVRSERVAQAVPAEHRQAPFLLQEVQSSQTISLIPVRSLPGRERSTQRGHCLVRAWSSRNSTFRSSKENGIRRSLRPFPNTVTSKLSKSKSVCRSVSASSIRRPASSSKHTRACSRH